MKTEHHEENDANYEKATVRKQLFFRVKIQFSQKVTILKGACIILKENQRTRSRDQVPKGQAIKSARGMPWHQEPMKDVTSCDKLRGAANEH